MTPGIEGQVVVLVVDDSPETLGMLNQALDQAGFTVLVALDGQQALTISQRIVPHIVLLDAIMPHLDGFETCRRLKQHPGFDNVPVIFMTGLSDTEDVVKGLEAGGVDYVTKPVKPAELVARMRVHLANARQTQRAHSALDTAGQYLFTAGHDGHLLWATPQVHQLLEQASPQPLWLARELPRQFQQWLIQRPEVGHALALVNAERPLQVRYVGEVGPGEHLLRLVDLARAPEAERIRKRFQVTEREAEVLFWIGQGKTNREIGQILDMSPRTVNKHLEQIFRKLCVENRTSAATLVLRCLES